MFPLPLDNLANLSFKNITKQNFIWIILPSIPFFDCLVGPRALASSMDSIWVMLGLPICVIHAIFVGRYWDIGPTRTLYVPAPLLRVGNNELVIFELHGPNDLANPTVQFIDYAILG
jgi:hypothetical protein